MTGRLQWTVPGAFEVAPGVHRVPLTLPLDGLRAVNVYVVESPGGPVLVDAGWAHGPGREQLDAALRSLGYALADIVRFLVTHLHYDHYTLAVPLRHEFGTPIAVSSAERLTFDAIHAPATQTLTRQMRQLRRHGAAELAAAIEASGSVHDIDRSAWGEPDEWIAPGAVIDLGDRRLEAIPTPGHTSGHMSFVDHEHGLLFAGDHVLPYITPSIGFEAAGSASPLGDFLSSLRRVERLSDMRLLPAHGPVASSAHARVRQLVGHHDERLAATASAIADGAESAYDVAHALPWTGRQRRFTELDAFNRMLAVVETAAHLELLADRQAVARSVRGGQYCYHNLVRPVR